MSDIFEDTRSTLMSLVKTFHAAEYSSAEVNYPGRMKTDVEKVQEEDFITIELTMEPAGMGLPARQCVRVRGQLVFNQFTRKNLGERVFTLYSGLLFSYFGLKTLSGITFEEVKPYNNSGIKGFVGRMNVVSFYIDHFNV